MSAQCFDNPLKVDPMANDDSRTSRGRVRTRVDAYISLLAPHVLTLHDMGCLSLPELARDLAGRQLPPSGSSSAKCPQLTIVRDSKRDDETAERAVAASCDCSSRRAE